MNEENPLKYIDPPPIDRNFYAPDENELEHERIEFEYKIHFEVQRIERRDFACIPISILKRKDLSSNTKLVFAAYCSRQTNRKFPHFFINKQTCQSLIRSKREIEQILSEDTGFSISQVRHHLGVLKFHGLFPYHFRELYEQK